MPKKILIYDEYADLGDITQWRIEDFSPNSEVRRVDHGDLRDYFEIRKKFLNEVSHHKPNLVILTGILPQEQIELAKKLRSQGYREALIIESLDYNLKQFRGILDKKTSILRAPVLVEDFNNTLEKYLSS